MSDLAALRVDESVALLTIRQPDKRNALDGRLADALSRSIGEATAQNARALVITGHGSAFCAGGDLKWLLQVLDHDAKRAERLVYEHFQSLIRSIIGSPCVIIGAINGPALGAGMDLALACDLRIGSPNACFSEPWARLGLVPGTGGAWLLSRLVGGGVAAELILEGDMIDAQRALSLGLLNRLVAEDRLLDTAMDMARRIAELPGRGIQESKALLWRASHQSLEEAMQDASAMQGPLLTAQEFRDAATAILNRRRRS